MKVRIIKVTKPKTNSSPANSWYEVRVKTLGFLWINGEIYRPGFPAVFSSLDEAMCRLDDLKKKKFKKELCCTIKI